MNDFGGFQEYNRRPRILFEVKWNQRKTKEKYRKPWEDHRKLKERHGKPKEYHRKPMGNHRKPKESQIKPKENHEIQRKTNIQWLGHLLLYYNDYL